MARIPDRIEEEMLKVVPKSTEQVKAQMSSVLVELANANLLNNMQQNNQSQRLSQPTSIPDLNNGSASDNSSQRTNQRVRKLDNPFASAPPVHQTQEQGSDFYSGYQGISSDISTYDFANSQSQNQNSGAATSMSILIVISTIILVIMLIFICLLVMNYLGLQI